jgi:hypothetical protein
MKLIFKFFLIGIFVILIYSPGKLQSQSLTNTLFGNIKETKFQINGYENIYMDLKKSSIINVAQNKEEIFDFVGDTYTGSFLNANKKEYILIVKLAEGQYCSFFGRADNGGKTTMIFTFDDKYEQIGEVGFQDAQTTFVEAVDVENDGITELILESSYGAQGCNYKWWMIFRKNFNEPLLRLTNYQSCEDSGSLEEMTRLVSQYKINDGNFKVESKLDYLIRENYESDIDLLRTENRLDVYEINADGMIHLPGENNVQWDENGSAF